MWANGPVSCHVSRVLEHTDRVDSGYAMPSVYGAQMRAKGLYNR